jgi:peptidoglycan lytic transglycosylase G
VTLARWALLLALLAAVLHLAWYRETRLPLRGADEPTLALVVPQGAGTDAIAQKLVELGLVRRPLPFKALVRLRGASGRLRAGQYRVEGPLSMEQLVDLLVRGEVVRHDITFPEGKTLEEMASLAAARGLDRRAFLAAARDPAPLADLDPAARDLEGYLFPDTYDLPASRSAQALVGRMLQRFRAVLTPLQPRLADSGLGVRQLVTLASIVELETARADERPRIAAVFLNRLRLGMPLQTDPTVIYALRKSGVWDGNIRKKDLDIDSPYNTYRQPGLPPGPIASPGREALLAVLGPAPVQDLYFVSRNDGSHEFSRTLAAHERAVDLFQRRGRGSRATPGRN